MAEINDTNINAEDVVSGVEVVKKSKKGLIAGGIAVLTAGVVAGGGLAAYSLSDFVKNQVKLRFSSPENYSTWIYEKNADALAEQLATAYEKRLEQLDDGQQMTFSLSYDTTYTFLHGSFHYFDRNKHFCGNCVHKHLRL